MLAALDFDTKAGAKLTFSPVSWSAGGSTSRRGSGVRAGGNGSGGGRGRGGGGGGGGSGRPSTTKGKVDRSVVVQVNLIAALRNV